MMWSTSDGASRGHIRSKCEILCCDLSHNHLHEILVTLEIDGEIRLFKRPSEFDTATSDGADLWEFVRKVSLRAPIVEVKVERSLLLAVTHSENGESGAIHVWEVLTEHLECLQHLGSIQCPNPPDRVEARHGGRFVEAFFVPVIGSHERRLPDGIYDIEWFDRDMRSLFKLRGIGDWRCDLRDAVARLEDDTSVSWLPLWHPIFRTCSKFSGCSSLPTADSASSMPVVR